jgi:hypothetical protein
MGWVDDTERNRAMGIRRNKTFVEQATEAVETAVETAREKAAPVIAEALEKASEVLAEAQEKAGPALADAKDKAGPMIADAADKARDRTVPLMTAGAAAAAKGAAAAADLAATKAAEGRDLAAAKAAELQGKQKKKHRLRTFLIFAGLATALGFVVKKLTSGSQQDNWQSSYTPTPPPSRTGSDTPIADAAAAASTEQADEGGAAPDEAISDAVEEQHEMTTPDQPAEVVDLAPGEEAAEQSYRKG